MAQWRIRRLAGWRGVIWAGVVVFGVVATITVLQISGRTELAAVIPSEDPALYRVVVGGKVGYIDEHGELVIAPQFDQGASYFREGLAAVVIEGRWGFIDINGTVVIQPTFDSTGSFGQCGLAPVRVGTKWGYIDRQGEWAIEPVFDFAESYYRGVARVGKATILGQLKSRFADVGMEMRWSFIDENGRFVATNVEAYLDRSEVNLRKIKKGGQFGYCNERGDIVIKPQFVEAGRFFDGRAPVEIRGMWGFIDTEGSIVVQPEYGWAYEFHRGLGEVSINGLRGYVDRDGSVVWTPTR